ncbi:hypothetical protein DNTS_017614 [Danionella cerebrum]|uniref:Synembryn n=1 Tax=Danionella cerebrum TaxID=2873325 RepID=A0A553N3E2_9TELE|nr:hypothetical protein DNTS_017614 [Danionella translucida]
MMRKLLWTFGLSLAVFDGYLHYKEERLKTDPKQSCRELIITCLNSTRMTVDVEKIIQFIKLGDQDNVQMHLDDYNTEFSECFFFDVEARERRKRLAAALIWFIRMRLQPGVLRVCLRTLRIISRDRKALAPLITDSAIVTLAQLGGILPLQTWSDEEEHEQLGSSHREVVQETHPENNDSITQRPAGYSETNEPVSVSAAIAACVCSDGGLQIPSADETADCGESTGKDGACGALARGKRDVRGEEKEEEEEVYDDGEMWRKEAMKALCNVIYNSPKAQERASRLRLLHALSKKIKEGLHASSAPSGQFYELRLLFLLTALRPELRTELQLERGVCILTAALEQCLEVSWGETHEVLTDLTAAPICKEVTQRALEILKTLFNITNSVHRQEVDEEAGALYRRLAAVLRHCLLVACDGEDLREELQGQTVNVLSALPLQCLDVLLSVPLSEGSKESGGVNMDCVHTLLLFMEKRLDRGNKLKEKLTPVLNLLKESSKAHRETRHYLRQQILPPLRDVELRPEQGNTLRGRLVRLMTHVDTDIKHCAADLLFVLCKENVGRFVKYTGYGNAAGLLAARGLLNGRGPSTQVQYSSDSDSDTEEYRQAKGRINPVTGRVEEEQPDPMEGMTEEEKEIEALRLINMFNRLSRDKIIQPMGVTKDGKLAPLCGQMRDSDVQEEEEEDVESETEQE